MLNGVAVIDADGHVLETDAEMEQYFDGDYTGHRRTGTFSIFPSLDGWPRGFVRGLNQADLDRVFEYKTLKFGVYRNPLWESMQHLVNHGTYHRGQVTTLLRQLGAQPIASDLMHFYRERATAAGA